MQKQTSSLGYSAAPDEALADGIELLQLARERLGSVWLGDEFVINLLLVAVLSRGHILLEDVPGVGKTTLAKGLARVLGLDFNRVQFTNDILPADILGGSVYNPADGSFSFTAGPIFTDFLLADEINRAPTRSQSAFLQAMEEGQVAADGVNHPLSELFTVIATQNPIDFDSTNPLPEAQLDRFLVAVTLGYPELSSELDLLNDYDGKAVNEVGSVFNREQIIELREQCDKVYLHPDIVRYIVEMARHSREDERLKLGVSPRGGLHLAQAARAYALILGRQEVAIGDVQKLIPYVWGHRLLPRHGRNNDRSLAGKILEEWIGQAPVPR